MFILFSLLPIILFSNQQLYPMQTNTSTQPHSTPTTIVDSQSPPWPTSPLAGPPCPDHRRPPLHLLLLFLLHSVHPSFHPSLHSSQPPPPPQDSPDPSFLPLAGVRRAVPARRRPGSAVAAHQTAAAAG
ncbi:putative formin-like protein 5 [Iris pallida]|uniref:Formin-like protein 5 n=1 Tax=Iris pallida TaxID=29817 RepID=A0AAX6GCG0_IRIPA|nr:putative formin-like protein 5 [Iris pallida]